MREPSFDSFRMRWDHQPLPLFVVANNSPSPSGGVRENHSNKNVRFTETKWDECVLDAFQNDRIRQASNFLNINGHGIAGLEPAWRSSGHADAVGRAGEDDGAGEQRG
jgi:hypothetical protein